MNPKEEKASPKATLAAVEQSAARLAQIMHQKMPNGWGFILVLASFGKENDVTYISDISRHNVHELLKELTERLGQQLSQPNGGSPQKDPGPAHSSPPPSSPS